MNSLTEIHSLLSALQAQRCSAHTDPNQTGEVSSAKVVELYQGSRRYNWSHATGQASTPQNSLCACEVNTITEKIKYFGMPGGYPVTVAPNYRRFFHYSMVGAILSNFAASIGYQSLLGGFFAGGSPQLWILKDLIPALVATYIANRVVSYEKRPKFWFHVSVFLYNSTVLLDMFVPSLSTNYMVAAAIFSSVLKQSSALMFMVCRACALQHFAIGKNLGDLTKKFNSFNMVIFTCATTAGVGFCYMVPSFTVQMSIVVAIVFLNQLFITRQAMDCIHYRIINVTTIHVLLADYMKALRENGKGKVLTPTEMSEIQGIRETTCAEGNLRERILVGPPIRTLNICQETLQEDVVFINRRNTFLIGFFEPSQVRYCGNYELPLWVGKLCSNIAKINFGKNKKSEAADGSSDVLFDGKRMVIFFQSECTAFDMFQAYVVFSFALLHHGQSTSEVKSFLRQCNTEQELWEKQTEEFRFALEEAEWDVRIPLLDHPGMRLTKLFVTSS